MRSFEPPTDEPNVAFYDSSIPIQERLASLTSRSGPIRRKVAHPSLEVPESLRAKFADYAWSVKGSWPDAVTWRLESLSEGVSYLKLTASNRYPRALDEAERTIWVHEFLPVPEVVERGSEDGVDWLVTRGLAGVDATDPRWVSRPEDLTRELAIGLRRFHEAPTDVCPFIFTADVALEHVRRRAEAGMIDPARDFHAEHQHLTVDAALERLQQLRPAIEDLVVCHGDYCLPNVLLADEQVSGFVDLGEIGVADRWWDLAVATWSLTWNLGEGWEDFFLRTYGIRNDERRVAFFRLLYDLAS